MFHAVAHCPFIAAALTVNVTGLAQNPACKKGGIWTVDLNQCVVAAHNIVVIDWNSVFFGREGDRYV
jgi:hypothetical protein